MGGPSLVVSLRVVLRVLNAKRTGTCVAALGPSGRRLSDCRDNRAAVAPPRASEGMHGSPPGRAWSDRRLTRSATDTAAAAAAAEEPTEPRQQLLATAAARAHMQGVLVSLVVVSVVRGVAGELGAAHLLEGLERSSRSSL